MPGQSMGGGQYGAPYGSMGGMPYGAPGGGMGGGHYGAPGTGGGPGMGGAGGMGGPGGVSGGSNRGSGGGAGVPAGGGDAASRQYNIMPAEDLVLDAREWDRQLLDPQGGQLQLLHALMQVEAWEAAVLMMQWLQVRLGVCGCVWGGVGGEGGLGTGSGSVFQVGEGSNDDTAEQTASC